MWPIPRLCPETHDIHPHLWWCDIFGIATARPSRCDVADSGRSAHHGRFARAPPPITRTAARTPRCTPRHQECRKPATDELRSRNDRERCGRAFHQEAAEPSPEQGPPSRDPNRISTQIARDPRRIMESQVPPKSRERSIRTRTCAQTCAHESRGASSRQQRRPCATAEFAALKCRRPGACHVERQTPGLNTGSLARRHEA